MALEDEEDQSPQSVLTLLTEIIIEILSRLPVDSLLRCKSVCKSWRSLISDPNFVKSHLILSNNHTAHHTLIFNNTRRTILKTCSLHDALYDNSINALKLDCPFKRSRKSVWIAGSCNGLVCIAVEEDALFKTLFIWNPSTRKSNRLPSNAHTGRRYWALHYGFGYEESTNDYKVVEISVKFTERFKYETSVEIYSLRNGSWKSFGTFGHGMPADRNAKFLNGALHWPVDKDYGSDFSNIVSDGVVKVTFSWSIISLDLATETYGEVMQPEYDESDGFLDLELGSLREWLCVLSNYHGIRGDLWVMKVYGVEDSWVKLVSIPYLTDPEIGRYSTPLCISNDGKILLRLGPKLIVYDSKNGSFSENQNFGTCVQASTFVESLVSPMSATVLGDR